jgi:hypothetical protein
VGLLGCCLSPGPLRRKVEQRLTGGLRVEHLRVQVAAQPGNGSQRRVNVHLVEYGLVAQRGEYARERDQLQHPLLPIPRHRPRHPLRQLDPRREA